MKRRRKKSEIDKTPAWHRDSMEKLRGKAAFFGCVVEPIKNKHGNTMWMLVVPGQNYMEVATTKNKQRYRSEHRALIIGIGWVLKNKRY